MLPNLIVPVLNRYDLLRRMFQSINYPVRDLLIIDNGGEFYDVLHSKFVKNVRVVNLPSNLGVASSWNLGIKLFPHDDRWFFASNDAWFSGNGLQGLSEARRDEITLSDVFPFWHVFCVGEMAFQRLGFFDEALHPAYHEDKDYERRAAHAEVPVRKIPIAGGHDNSSTIRSDNKLSNINNKTFADNTLYYNSKMARDDYGEGRWDLQRRRRNSWDTPR